MARSPVLRLGRLALSYELRLWRSLYRWIFRRPLSRDPSAVPFSYAGPLTPIFAAFIGVSIVELPILHFLLPWPTVRTISLALGAYGLFWMIGLLASIRVNPHLVTDAGLRVRSGLSHDFTIPWSNVESVGSRYRILASDGSFADSILHIGVSKQTSTDIVLREPITLPVKKTNGQAVVELRIFADDAKALARAARAHLAAMQTD